MLRLPLLLACGMFPLIGCADESGPEYAAKSPERPPAATTSPEVISADSDAFAKSTTPNGGMAGGMMGGAAGGMMSGMMGRGMTTTDGAVTALANVDAAPMPPVMPANAAGISRKVIYDAVLNLAVEGVDQAANRVGELVEEAGGYIAEQNMVGSPGSHRSLNWKLRIPIDKFESFVTSVTGLGELEQFNRKSQDVTAEFYDVEARIKNKKVEEQTLLKILEERSGKLEEVLKVEMELSRVRGEIEQFQGRIRVLENLSSLATLTLNVHERVKYEPVAPVVADFPTQIARTWQSSVQSMVDLGKAVTLFVVSQAIWTPFWIAGALLVWIFGRRLIALARTQIHISTSSGTPST